MEACIRTACRDARQSSRLRRDQIHVNGFYVHATQLFCCSMSSATLLKSSLVRKVGNGSRHSDCCRNATQCFFLADVISYSSAIIACEKGRKWKHAFGLLAEMRDNHHASVEIKSMSMDFMCMRHNYFVARCHQLHF